MEEEVVLVDTHCHFDAAEFDPDRDALYAATKVSSCETASAGAPAAAPGRFPRARGAFPSAGAAPGVNQPMKNFDEFLGNARVVPYFKGGEPYGFRVSNLGSDAPVYGLGMRTGDIIRSVNGVPIRTPEDAFKAYQQFQDQANVQLDVERNGQSTTVTVPITK